MKLLLIGASGGTGTYRLHEALAQGHEVTALVRNPVAIQLTHDRMRVPAGDPPRGAYRVVAEGDEVVSKIARADVAGFLLHQLTSNCYLRQSPRLGY